MAEVLTRVRVENEGMEVSSVTTKGALTKRDAAKKCEKITGKRGDQGGVVDWDFVGDGALPRSSVKKARSLRFGKPSTVLALALRLTFE